MKSIFNKSLVVLFVSILLYSCQSDTVTVNTPDGEKEMPTDELLKTIGESYVFGYPLVLMDLTKNVTTNAKIPHPVKSIAPINQLGHYREFPDHTLTAIVKPNVDTYYSIAWLDLKKEPQVLSMPATDRYYVLPFYDAYSNIFASPGTRTTGTAAQSFLVVGPTWKGAVPKGLTLIQSPTQMVWMLGRIQVNSDGDGATTVRAIQDGMSLVPLSALGKKDYVAPNGIVKDEYKNVVPVKAIRELDIDTYLNRLAELMVDNPPAITDSAMVRKMASIGLVAGQPFDFVREGFILNTKLEKLPEFIHKKLEARRSEPDKSILTNGWIFVNKGIGTYGTDYIRRAYIDFIGLGALIPEDAVYPNCAFDKNGKRLDASKNYQIHFEADQIPPVNAFWSLTAYNADEFLVKNDLDRFALGDRDELNFNSDGSLDLYIQASPPVEDKIKNWLPIPKSGAFYLTLRLYWPKENVLKGEWNIPTVNPVD